ncbi:MAG: PilN domain-containing protein [Sedimentisphaerales bacterium]
MREIDFLPDWYKHGRAEQRKHREFYIAIGLIMLVMIVWSVFANGRVAAVKAKNATLQNARLIQTRGQTEYDDAQNQFEQMQAKQRMLDSVKSNMAVSNVLAEISHLLTGGVVLKKLEIKAEPLPSQDNAKSEIKIYSADSAQSKTFDNKVRFKIVISGLASDAAQVAETINMLEMSDYFFQVIPGFSRNIPVGERQMCEFELTCYLSNYILKQ